MSPKRAAFLGAAIGAVALDQATKAWVVSTVPTGTDIAVVPGVFHLSHVLNRVGSFGLLSGTAPPLRQAVLLGLPAVAMVMAALFYRRLRPDERAAAAALGLVLGGVAGNLLDRLARGAVIDFLRLYLWDGYGWPDFNLADVAALVGVAMLVLGPLRRRRTA